MSKKYLRAKDVAAKTGLAIQTIYQYTSEKRIPFIKFGSRTTLYEETAIEDLTIQRRRIKIPIQ